MDETTYRATRHAIELRRAADDRGEGKVDADLRPAGARGALTTRVDVAHEARASSSAASTSSASCGTRSAGYASEDVAAPHARRRAGDRKEPPRLRALADRRGRPRAHHLAAGSLSRLRRRNHALGARRDRQGAGRNPRAGSARAEAARRSVAPSRSSSTTRPMAAGSSRISSPSSASQRERARRRPAQRGVLRLAALLRGDGRSAAARPRRRGPPLGRRKPARLRRRARRLGDRRSAPRRRDRASGASRPTAGLGRRQAERDDARARAALRRADRASPRRASRPPVLGADSQQVLLERAGGNPLYAEQFAELFLEQGSAEALSLPETLQGIIAARLDGLPPRREGAPARRRGRREGLLDRGAAPRAGRGGGSPALARAKGVRAPAAPYVGRGRDASSRSPTRSSATSPTDRSRAPTAPRSTATPPSGSSPRPARGPRRDARVPLELGARARPRRRWRRRTSSSSDTRVRGARRGRSRVRAERFRGGRSALRERPRAVARATTTSVRELLFSRARALFVAGDERARDGARGGTRRARRVRRP